MCPRITGPTCRPMPICSGSRRSCSSRRLSRASAAAIAARRAQRLQAGLLGLALEAEQRHDAVADELVDAAALLLDRPAHRLEILVQHEHHVVGQAALRHAGEGAQVGEQHRDLALDALARIDPQLALGRPGRSPAAAARPRGRGSGAPGRRGGCRAGGADPRQHARLVGAQAAAAARRPAPTRMRQVEQRPRPPHTEACGMPAARLASSTLVPGLIATVVPSG